VTHNSNNGKTLGISPTWKPRLVNTPVPTILAITKEVAVSNPILVIPEDFDVSNSA
jgi:hypothetical protein